MRAKKILLLATLRSRLLFRQKLGWVAALGGVALFLVSLAAARSSFVQPQKIFWDFSLGTTFLLSISLGLYTSTQLFQDEKQRRTLHLLLSSGISRADWVIGNFLGLWATLASMILLWFFLVSGISMLSFSESMGVLPLQSTLLLIFEVGIVLALGFLFSLFVRPILALLSLFSLVAFLHAASDLQRVLTDQQVGRFIDDRGISVVFYLSRLLPPLEWFDLKSFVGYEMSFPWPNTLFLIFLACLWIALIQVLSIGKLQRMDL